MITMDHKRRRQTTKRSNNEQLKAGQAIVPTGGPEEQMPAIDKPLKGLKFVDVTPRYLQGTRDSVEQRSIRVHVMQDFIRQKKQTTDALEPPAMAGTVSSHIHRFRISKPRLPDKPLGTESQESRQSASSRTSPNTIRDVRGLTESETGDLASGHRSSHVGVLPVEERVSAPHPKISSNLPGVMARMDPFARLPIDGSFETHETLDYCEQHLLPVLSHVPMQTVCLNVQHEGAQSRALMPRLRFAITRSSYDYLRVS